MNNLGVIEAITLTVGDEYNDVGGSLFTRLTANFNPRTVLQSGAGLQNASSADAGVTVTFSSGVLNAGAAGAIFRVLSNGTTIQESVVVARDSDTQLTLTGAGIEENFTGASWELVTPSDTIINVETTLGFPSEGAVVVDGIFYRYTSITATTFSGITGLNPDGEFQSGAIQLHMAGTVLQDQSRNFSYIDQLRREFFVGTATGEALDAVGRNVGVLRPAAQPDSVFREVIKAIAYTRRGTEYSLEILLTALFGASNFSLFEDLTGGRPDRLRNNNTVFFRGDGTNDTRFAGKTFIDGTELVQLASSTTGTLAAVPQAIADVRLAPEPRRSGERLIAAPLGTISGTQAINSDGVGTIAVVTESTGTFNAAIRRGDRIVLKSGGRGGQTATILSAGGGSTLTLAIIGDSDSELGHLRFLPEASGNALGATGVVFSGVEYEVVRPISRPNIYRPSDEVYIEYPGDAGTPAFTFAGTGTETSVAPFGSANGNSFLRLDGDISSGTALYTRALRITDASQASVEVVMAIDASTDITDYDRMQIRVGTGARDVAVAFRRVSPDVELGFVDSSTGTLLSGAASTQAEGDFFTLRIEIDPIRQEAYLYVDNALVETAALSDFAATSSRLLAFGNYATAGDTETGQVFLKTLNWYAEDHRSLWNVNEEGATFSTSSTLSDVTGTSPAFVAGDIGRQLRIANFNTVNARGGCVRGVWEVASVSSATAAVLTGPTSTWSNATFRVDRPGQIIIRDQARAFRWPDVQGHSIEILAPHPDAGIYEITTCVPPEDLDTTFDARFGALANQLNSGEYIQRDFTNVVNVSGAPSAWAGVDTGANWRIIPRTTGGADTGPLNYQLVDASTRTGASFTLRQDPSIYGIGAGEVVEVLRSTVLSAQLSDPASRTTYNAFNDYDQYPFFLSDDIGIARELIPLLLAAGVIPDFESLSVDDAGFHVR